MPTELSEPESVDRAVREALTLVDAGDRPLVAADYVAEEYEITHRFGDILQRVRDTLEADEYYIASDASDVVHKDPDCPSLQNGSEPRPATDEEVQDRRICNNCESSDIPTLEEAKGGETA